MKSGSRMIARFAPTYFEKVLVMSRPRSRKDQGSENRLCLVWLEWWTLETRRVVVGNSPVLQWSGNWKVAEALVCYSARVCYLLYDAALKALSRRLDLQFF